MFKLLDQLKTILKEEELTSNVDNTSLATIDIQNADPLETESFPKLKSIRQQFQQAFAMKGKDLSFSEKHRFHFNQENEQYLQELMNQKCSYSQAAILFNQRFHTDLKPNQIHQRWKRVQSPDIKKGRWCSDEDCKLQQLCKEFAGNLQQIVVEMGGRTLLQIRKRMKILKLI